MALATTVRFDIHFPSSYHWQFLFHPGSLFRLHLQFRVVPSKPYRLSQDYRIPNRPERFSKTSSSCTLIEKEIKSGIIFFGNFFFADRGKNLKTRDTQYIVSIHTVLHLLEFLFNFSGIDFQNFETQGPRSNL